ncbi:pleckstrin homology domain-containing family S member 1 isoform X2 [Pyxicephalus adspersus]|uniref:pleckstrin homology domain-containing family S member 1 isoform X2 n=1 Tax=Pyxicephalus adspersus TaxID=30357 RepID=UPI003B5AF60E
MLPKRPNTEIENTIIKQGCLIKSPPVYLFSKRASWKARLFKLCKSPMDSYYLRYFAYNGMSEELKGNIAVSDIKSIQLGSNTMDKIVTITRLFNNRPENVLCIKTSKRDYYLVDDNVNNIADWHKSITDVWVKINQAKNVEGPQIAHPALVTPPLELTPDETVRPKSYPEEHPCTDPALMDVSCTAQ